MRRATGFLPLLFPAAPRPPTAPRLLFARSPARGLSSSSSSPLPPPPSSSTPMVVPATPLATIPDPVIPPPYFVDTNKLTQILETQFSPRISQQLVKAAVLSMQEKANELEHNLIQRDKYDVMQYSNRTETQNLRNELRSYEKTEHLVVRTQLQSLEREIDQVNQKFRDDIGNLKTNLMIELNDQKTDFREGRKERDRKISDVNYKLSLFVSDLKGEIEAAKLDIINYTIAALIGLVVFIGFGFKMIYDHKAKKERALANLADGEAVMRT